MHRRTFLQSLAAAGISLPAFNTVLAVNGKTASSRPHLVLIELAGGNDGLNTVIPFRNQLYRNLRPTIAIDEDKVLHLDESTGLHPALKSLLPIWKNGDMAIVNGVGYPDPNRSHFRSIEIWETGSDADEVRQEGWLTPITRSLASPDSSITAIALAEDQGPLAGSTNDTIVFDNLKQFIRQAKELKQQVALTRNDSLRHILDVQQRTQDTALQFADSMKNGSHKHKGYPKNKLATQLKTVAEIISSQAGPRLFKVGLGSFDTHQGQLGRHANLLKQLATGIQAFQKSMEETGMWNNVLVMTYSEFGRRAGQNGSNGTDHGTAAPQFIFGGSVKGGIHGAQPSLAHLENDDMVHTVDFRSLYRSIAEDWLGDRHQQTRYQDFDKLNLF